MKPLACGLPLGVIVANEKAAAAIGAGVLLQVRSPDELAEHEAVRVEASEAT